MSDFTKLLALQDIPQQKRMLEILMSFAVNKTNNVPKAENLVQETLRKALEKQDQFTGEREENLYKWLSTIMQNTFIDIGRKGTFVDKDTSNRLKREINVIDQVSEHGAIDDTSTLIVERDAKECLSKLSDIKNEIISLRQNQISFDEISHILGITSGNARKIYVVAKKEFIECMEGGVT
tara:strand:- start:280 stop:819 length:540 start_codon:yes stop_codon:yes gene_type:complete